MGGIIIDSDGGSGTTTTYDPISDGDFDDWNDSDTSTSTEDDGVSHGVRDMDADVADGPDETTGEVAQWAVEDGTATDPNAQVEDTGYQVDGDPDDSPGGAENRESNDPSNEPADGSAFVDVKVIGLALLVAAVFFRGR